MGKTLDALLEEKGIVYEIRAVLDGEVIAKFTSGISADDVAGNAWAIDECVEKFVIQEEQDRIEFEKEAAAEEALERAASEGNSGKN